MNDRREFLKTAALAATTLTLASTGAAFAATPANLTNIIYTADNPGKWKEKVGSHAPQVTITGTTVAIATKHPMSEDHFIVRHALVLQDGTVVGATTFTPKDKPESSYELPAGYKGKFYATSFCNLHDFWLSEASA